MQSVFRTTSITAKIVSTPDARPFVLILLERIYIRLRNKEADQLDRPPFIFDSQMPQDRTVKSNSKDALAASHSLANAISDFLVDVAPVFERAL
ncbi:hypothetical protein Mal48_47010 [Thalassoglobus polymorphus]|uniref:Uncharacterized protein n=1 Tax=Thalassoglobus polymorphus TaxID=2527994 RepID=A0A517QUY4_9PLAN|nr:hypothetical protein Mal48_47010 [Thalassoglobus polymorphus]